MRGIWKAISGSLEQERLQERFTIRLIKLLLMASLLVCVFADCAGAVYLAWGLFVQKVCLEVYFADRCVSTFLSWDCHYISSSNVRSLNLALLTCSFRICWSGCHCQKDNEMPIL